MLLWKLIDGRLFHSENMTDEEALAAGYKPLVWTPEPDEGVYKSSWVENETTIDRVWTEMPEPEPTVEDKAEAYDILIGGE